MQPISLVIPVYNEKRSCAKTVHRVRAVLATLPEGSEALFVNDGSQDGSGEALAGALREGEPLRLITHIRNKGYGASLKTGIRAASHAWIAIADADGTYPIEDLPKLLAAIDGGARMAVGARPLGQQPTVRRPAKAFLNAYASYLAGTRIPDLNSGLRVFHRDDALRLERLLPDGFSFTSTITMALASAGEPVVFLPIRYRERVGKSKIRPVRDMGGFMLLVCRLAMAFNPLRIFGPASAALLALGVVLLSARFFMADKPFGLATTIILLVGGVQLLAVGLLADLINRRGGGGT
ncbi:MAG: hypothetical protein PWP23_798 [Candidatus Sumerlaeota bacterium]|nr:hypothetical protein [Candidatus Sumerlaeota bacterium]